MQAVEFRNKNSSLLVDIFWFFLFVFIFVPLWLPYLVIVAIYGCFSKAFCKSKVLELSCEPLNDDELSPVNGKREYDLVVIGVTGFTGGFAAEYLAKNYDDKGLSWALAGRSERKLKAVVQKIKALNPNLKDVPIMIVDSLKMDDMERLAQSTHSVASFVGPFQKYGSPLVRACAKYGTQYADSTGESAWMRQMIALYHDAAAKSKCRILHQTAYDSVPADLVTYLCHRELQSTGEKLKSMVVMNVSSMNASGGTLETAIMSLSGATKLVYPKLGMDALYYVDGKRSEGRVKIKDAYHSYHPEIKQYGAFFALAAGNGCATRRTGAFLGYDHTYEETSVKGSFFANVVGNLGQAMLGSGLVFPPMKWLFFKTGFLPLPGSGAPREVLEQGFYWYNATGTGTNGTKVYGLVGANKDGGYIDTARMVVETALTAFELRESEDYPFGILTPGCLGDALCDRLEKTGTILQCGREFCETRFC